MRCRRNAMAAREPLKHRRRRARRINLRPRHHRRHRGLDDGMGPSETAEHTTKSYKAPKPVTYSEFEKQGPWVPLPDARRLFNVAWRLDSR